MTEFAVWAPGAPRVRLRTAHRTVEMVRDPDGWWRVGVPEAAAGTDYTFLLDDGNGGGNSGNGDRNGDGNGEACAARPDPRSPWQPAGVHGPSRVYDHAAYRWGDGAWTGRILPGAVLYELHIGTFTAAGTFDAAIDRLDHLVDLGVDMVELLPVGAFNGEHNWGYDGVCWYAPHERYGGPDGFKRFVDACHARGLGVLLDVVYNHFGPSGAYAPMFAPYLAGGANAWGRSVNLDGPASDEVRRYVIDSVLMWLRDYHVDGLRLDAVHALVDHRAVHLLEEIAIEVESLATHLGRRLSLIAESDLNDPRLITPREAGGYGLTAQWDDDVHHALHALLTGERQGYYGDFGSAACLARVLEGAFFHAGTISTFRGRVHGRPVDRHRTPGHRFVAYLQNHDQVGNRAHGDRISTGLDHDLVRIGALLLFTSAFTPMLFMGEEWAATTPWQFFTSHPEPDLAAAVGRGRRDEFARHGWPAGDVPDPQDPATFRRSTLDWDELARPDQARMLDFYRRLIALRKAYPDLSDPRLDRVAVSYGDGWLVMRRGSCAVVANLTPETVQVDATRTDATRTDASPIDTRPGPPASGHVLLATGPGVRMAAGGIELPGHSGCVVRR